MKMPIALLAAALLAGCTAVSRPDTSVTTSSMDFGQETLALINSYRASQGVAPLAPHPGVEALARQHSQNQARSGRMSHDGFRQRSAQSRAAGTNGVCTENVGIGYRSARELFSGWRNSSGHNRNLLRPNLRYAGVSVVGRHSTFFACG